MCCTSNLLYQEKFLLVSSVNLHVRKLPIPSEVQLLINIEMVLHNTERMDFSGWLENFTIPRPTFDELLEYVRKTADSRRQNPVESAISLLESDLGNPTTGSELARAVTGMVSQAESLGVSGAENMMVTAVILAKSSHSRVVTPSSGSAHNYPSTWRVPPYRPSVNT